MSRRRAKIRIYQGDDLAELQRLRIAVRDAVEAEQQTDATLADTSAEDARLAYNEFREIAHERADEVTLEALPRRHWRTLRLAHPPREVETTTQVEVTELVEEVTEAEDGTKTTTTRHEKRMKPVTETTPHEDDEDFGVNTETLPEELLGFVDPHKSAVRTIAEAPDGFDIDDLSEPDFDRLFLAALVLNRQYVDPKALSVFAPTPENDET